jgi:prolyl oligopeptidase
MGGSNGGLLVGACLTQHPDLFGACVPHVGVFDMLRFHRFTIGWAWTGEVGSHDVPDEYVWLRGYSPLHNVRPGARYPATLLLTGDHGWCPAIHSSSRPRCRPLRAETSRS